MGEQNYTHDGSNDRKYYTTTPNLVRLKSRSPYDYMLWCTIKELVGETGECYICTENLATLAMMSTGKVCDSRAYLIECGLLDGELKRRDSGDRKTKPTWHLTIPDIWAENIQAAQDLPTFGDKINQKKKQKAALKAEKSLAKSKESSPHESIRESSPHESIRESSPHESKESSPRESNKRTIRSSFSSCSNSNCAREGEQTVFEIFEQNGFGLLSQIIVDDLTELEANHANGWVRDAMIVAVEANERRLNYVKGILKNWKAHGKGNRFSQSKTTGANYASNQGVSTTKRPVIYKGKIAKPKPRPERTAAAA